MNILKRQFRLTALASALSLAFSVSHANAQTPGQAEPAKALPAINVTAERTGSFKSDVVQVGTFRDMAPLDVPQASNVVTREVLDAQAATTLFGALRNTAGVTRSQLSGSTYDNIAIRGILVENRGNSTMRLTRTTGQSRQRPAWRRCAPHVQSHGQGRILIVRFHCGNQVLLTMTTAMENSHPPEKELA